MNTTIVSSPLGKIKLVVFDAKLHSLEFVNSTHDTQAANDPISKNIANELHEYFQNSRTNFMSAIELCGTPFQQKVWRALQAIPSGKTITYGELAKKLSSSPRAIGQACRTNPIPIIVPCHRVVAKSNLGGYSGQRSGNKLAIKQWLLKHEGCF